MSERVREEMPPGLNKKIKHRYILYIKRIEAKTQRYKRLDICPTYSGHPTVSIWAFASDCNKARIHEFE